MAQSVKIMSIKPLTEIKLGFVEAISCRLLQKKDEPKGIAITAWTSENHAGEREIFKHPWEIIFMPEFCLSDTGDFKKGCVKIIQKNSQIKPINSVLPYWNETHD